MDAQAHLLLEIKMSDLDNEWKQPTQELWRQMESGLKRFVASDERVWFLHFDIQFLFRWFR